MHSDRGEGEHAEGAREGGARPFYAQSPRSPAHLAGSPLRGLRETMGRDGKPKPGALPMNLIAIAGACLLAVWIAETIACWTGYRRECRNLR
jgi:hypothetical protein